MSSILDGFTMFAWFLQWQLTQGSTEVDIAEESNVTQ